LTINKRRKQARNYFEKEQRIDLNVNIKENMSRQQMKKFE